MNKRTIEQLESALDAVRDDLAPRVEELARRSTEASSLLRSTRGSSVVRLNDVLRLLELETEEFWTMRGAS